MADKLILGQVLLNDRDLLEIEEMLTDDYFGEIVNIENNNLEINDEAIRLIEIGMKIMYRHYMKKSSEKGNDFKELAERLKLFNNPFGDIS